MKIKVLTNDEFLEFSKRFRPSSMYQTVEYALTMNNNRYDSLLVGLVDDDKLLAASLILIQKINGFRYASAPRGFLIDYNNTELLTTFTKLLKKFLGKKDIVAIKVNPMIIREVYDSKGNSVLKNVKYDEIFKNMTKLGYFHLGYNNYFEALKPRFEAMIDISKPINQIFKNIDKGFKAKIRKAIKNGVNVYHGDFNDLNLLYEETKDKYPRDLKYYEDLYKYFDKKNSIDFYYCKLDTTEYLKYTQKKYNEVHKLSFDLGNKLIGSTGNNTKIINKKLQVDKEVSLYSKQLVEATNLLRDFPDGIVIASALVIKWLDTAYLVMSGYNEKYRKFNGTHLMIWKFLARYAKLGFKYFNFGGVSNIKLQKNKYKGLNQFKLGFNADVTEYIGDFELITNRPLYFVYKNSFGISDIFK